MKENIFRSFLIVTLVTLCGSGCDRNSDISSKSQIEAVEESLWMGLNSEDFAELTGKMMLFKETGQNDLDAALAECGVTGLGEAIEARIAGIPVEESPINLTAYWKKAFQTVLRNSQVYFGHAQEVPVAIFVNPYLGISCVSFWTPDFTLNQLRIINTDKLVDDRSARQKPREDASTFGGWVAAGFRADFSEIDHQFSFDREDSSALAIDDAEELAALISVAQIAAKVRQIQLNPEIMIQVGYFIRSWQTGDRAGMEKYLGPIPDNVIDEMAEELALRLQFEIVHAISDVNTTILLLASPRDLPMSFLEIVFVRDDAGTYSVPVLKFHELSNNTPH